MKTVKKILAAALAVSMLLGGALTVGARYGKTSSKGDWFRCDAMFMVDED